MKPKILMVADQPNWAYDHMARWVIEELRSKYDFYMDYCIFHPQKDGPPPRLTWRGKIKKQLHHLKFSLKRRILPAGQDYDLICFLGWYFPFLYDFDIRNQKIIQGIFTDGFPPQGHTLIFDHNLSIEQFVRVYLGRTVALICGSKLIFERYKPYVENIFYCTGAINTRLFRPPPSRPEDKKEFVVGWTGDPRRQFKGFYDFVLPAVEKASSLRKNIVLKTRFKGPCRTLPKFYQDVDVILIASSADAGPSSFLEAGACGVPAISTKIGFPAEVIRDKENGILVDRSVDELAEAILYLYDNRNHLRRMSEKIRHDIVRDWDYKARRRLWDEVFRNSLLIGAANSGNPRNFQMS